MCSGSFAASPVVAEGPGVTISTDDLKADAERIPGNQKSNALGNSDAVQQAASNLYVRRALAAEAVRDGLDKDPVIAAILQLVRDRALSDARLAAIDAANKPNDEAVEAATRAAYRANPARFRSGDQARASHILIAGDGDAAKAEAEKVLAELKAGANFEALAKQKSADPGSAERGGDLGYFDRGRMLPEFEDAVQLLKNPGELSGLVRTQFGWHIIRLEGRRPGGQRTYEEVREDLRRTVLNQLQSDARLREAVRLSGAAKFNREVIEAFSATYRK